MNQTSRTVCSSSSAHLINELNFHELIIELSSELFSSCISLLPPLLQTTSTGPCRTYFATCNCITKSILGAKLENRKAK